MRFARRTESARPIRQLPILLAAHVFQILAQIALAAAPWPGEQEFYFAAREAQRDLGFGPDEFGGETWIEHAGKQHGGPLGLSGNA